MDAIEKAIRNAFDRGDPSDRAFREKVYRSAFAALDRALQAKPDTAGEIAKRRKESLVAKIAEIESEFIPAVPQVESSVSTQSQASPAVPPSDAGREPEVTSSPETDARLDRTDAAFEPRIEREDVRGRPGRASEDYPDDYVEPPRGEKRPRRGRPWAAAFVGVTLLSAAGIGGWWAYDSGFFQSPAERDQTVPNPPQELEEEDFTPPGEEAGAPQIPGGPDNLDDWIAVFEPSDPTVVTAPGDTSAEVMEAEADGDAFIRIRSGASGSPILFDVGQGILEQVAGRRAVFNIVARAEEGTQISVDCDLGELGDCGRKRYAVGVTREEFLFEVELPDADPAGGGTIAINPDIENGGKALDVYEIRVTAAAAE